MIGKYSQKMIDSDGTEVTEEEIDEVIALYDKING